MAIPFNLPSYEETENNYQAMDELLAQLFRVLRQILLRQQQQNAAVTTNSNNAARHGRSGGRARERSSPAAEPDQAAEAAPVTPEVVPATGRLPLPDVVPQLARRPRTRKEAAPPAPAPAHAPHKVELRDNWTQVGEELRHFADEFASDEEAAGSKTCQRSGASQRRQKGSGATEGGLLSLLVPPAVRRPVVMAVLLLFGWQALHRR